MRDTITINDTKYEIWDDQVSKTRLYYRDIKKGTDDIEFAIGSSKRKFYTIEVKELLTYKEAYEIMYRLHYMAGVLKSDVEGIVMCISNGVHKGNKDGN